MTELLTYDEVCDLPEGTPITITWSGGNGPHNYVLGMVNGSPYAQNPDKPQFDEYNPIRFVGNERCHTHVSLTKATT